MRTTRREWGQGLEEPPRGYSKTSKVMAGLFFMGAGAWALSKVSGSAPSYQQLCYLLSSQNQFSLRHVAILRRLAEACNYSVDAMMQAIEKPAMDVASVEVSGLLPPAILPAGTQYTLNLQYPDPVAAGRYVRSSLSMYPETGQSVYATARAETISIYCKENVFPVLRQMFSDVVRFIKQGMNDLQIFNIMSGPNYGADKTLELTVPAQSAKYATKLIPV